MKEKTHYFWIVIAGLVVLLNVPRPISDRIKAVFREALAPFSITTRSWFRNARERLDSAHERRVMTQSTDDLMKELFVLRNRVRQLQEIKRENRELRRILDFSSRADASLIPCQTVSRGDISGWWQTVRLNKGSRAGISDNMAVIGFDGLVGRVLSVSENTSDILLITDRNCKVPARIARLDAVGIMRGDALSFKGEGPLRMLMWRDVCRMEYIELAHEVRIGDEVVTSGLGGMYPSGAVIGHVTSIREDRSGLYKIAEIAPYLDVINLEHAFVVRQ